MPRICTVCSHKQRASIDAAIVAGEPNRAISRQFGVSRHALDRHKSEHVPAHLAQAQAASEVAHADDLLARLDALTADAKRIGKKAEKLHDYRAALAAVRELVRIVELLAKLRGELDERAQVNVLITSPEWIQTRTVLMRALLPFPEARFAAAEALSKIEGPSAHDE